MAVVQLGLAMMPRCFLTSPGLISGMTSGTESSMRKALELSTTTQPALAAMGANSLEMPAPALKRAMSTPAKESFVNSWTAISWPRNFIFLPAERAEASRVSLPTGKLRFSSVLIISTPTAPVAPTTATCGLRFIKADYYNAGGGGVNGGACGDSTQSRRDAETQRGEADRGVSKIWDQVRPGGVL